MAWHGMRGQCIALEFFVLAHISTHGVEKRNIQDTILCTKDSVDTVG